MTKRGVLIALTNSAEGRDDEFNKWYNEQHLVDVMKIPGVVGAKRYKISAFQHVAAPQPFRYAAVYELATDDIASVARELGIRRGTAAMPLSETLQEERQAWFFEEIFDKRG